MRDAPNKHSAFKELGLKEAVAGVQAEIVELYQMDTIPWVIGYSGGKDSTAVLQLVWLALRNLPPEKRTKPVHVISTDTLVENPIVAGWVTRSLDTMREAATREGLPITPHRLTPATTDTFWVNLIGKGYPAPRHKFRWCTARLKIAPSNTFIRDVVRSAGEAILLLGTRKAESTARARTMAKHDKHRLRERLTPNSALPNALVYTPIEDWTNDDVWLFLMQVVNPWGYNNKDLLTMYQGASPDGECPLVVDTSTPSCGDSRFGCWTCTLVEKDKSMQAMIQNDDEKEWMLPLLQLRDELDIADDRHLRDFRRLSGAVQLFHGRSIAGPYTQEARENWLKKLLEAQAWIRKNGPEHARGIELITLDELQEIRRIWVVDKHEFEDSVPRIYREAMGESYPGMAIDDDLVFGQEEMHLLREVADGDPLRFQMVRELLDVERRYRAMSRRAGLYEALEGAIRRHFYEGESDATDRAQRKKTAQDQAQNQRYERLARTAEDQIALALAKEQP